MKITDIQGAIKNGMTVQQVYDRLILDVNSLRCIVRHREKTIAETKSEMKRLRSYEITAESTIKSLQDRVDELKISVDSLSSEKSKLLRTLNRSVNK